MKKRYTEAKEENRFVSYKILDEKLYRLHEAKDLKSKL